MTIETTKLRGIAPALEVLGAKLVEDPTEDVSALGLSLVQASVQYLKLPVDGEIEITRFPQTEWDDFLGNLTELAGIFRAAGSPARRDTPLLQAVGDAADQLSIGAECREIATELVKILVECPGEVPVSQE